MSFRVLGGQSSEAKGHRAAHNPIPRAGRGLMALRAVSRADVKAACERLHALAGAGRLGSHRV